MPNQDQQASVREIREIEAVYSVQIPAGRRTYFIDVQATRSGEYFLVMTESRRRTNPDGSTTYVRNKIHVYKEDLFRFSQGLREVGAYLRRECPEFFEPQEPSLSLPESHAIEELTFEQL